MYECTVCTFCGLCPCGGRSCRAGAVPADEALHCTSLSILNRQGAQWQDGCCPRRHPTHLDGGLAVAGLAVPVHAPLPPSRGREGDGSISDGAREPPRHSLRGPHPMVGCAAPPKCPASSLHTSAHTPNSAAPPPPPGAFPTSQRPHHSPARPARHRLGSRGAVTSATDVTAGRAPPRGGRGGGAWLGAWASAQPPAAPRPAISQLTSPGPRPCG